jgi:hypothetical protein
MAIKVCTNCGESWETMEDLLDDETLVINGYQANFKTPTEGLFIFTHKIPECQGSFAVKVNNFISLHPDPEKIAAFTPHTGKCEGYCETMESVDLCSEENCRGRIVREVLQLVRNRVKKA